MSVTDWSLQPNSNAMADRSIPARDGMAGREFPEAIRGLMAKTVALALDQGGALVSTGFDNVYEVATNSGFSSIKPGVSISFWADRANTAEPYLNVDGSGPRRWLSADGLALPAGAIQGGLLYTVAWNAALPGTAPAWRMVGAPAQHQHNVDDVLGALPAQTAARSIKANLLAEPGRAQDVGLADFGRAISLGITSDDLVTFRVRVRAVRVSGFSSVGDVGDGAIYVSADTAFGPRPISNGLFYWNLTFPGDVQIGHFGAGLGGNDTAAVTSALTYAIAQCKRAVLPRGAVLVDAVQPVWPTNGTPFSPGRLWLSGSVQGGSIIRKTATGGTGTLLTIGETPSKSIKNDVTIEGVTFDGVSIDKTYSGYSILDAWRVNLRNVEAVNCQFGHQLLGCIYVSAQNINNHACRYGGAALNLNDSYFAPLVGPANIHTHANCTYNENTNRGYIFDYGSMLVMLACNIEYNGSMIGDADHGGLYVGDKIGYVLPGTVMHGAHLIGCWFENNKGREQINLRSGRNIVDATQFVVPPGFSTYGIVRDGGVLSVTNGTVFAADFISGNVFDGAGATLGGNRITSDCALYSLKINPDLWLIERIQGQGATVRLASGVSVPNNAATILPWNGLLVDRSAPCFSYDQNTRMTVPANARRVRISAGFLWASNGSGVRQVSILKNGSEEVAATSSSAHGFNAHSIISPVIKVVPGDYFEVRAFQNSGGSLGLNFNQADAFQMEIVS